jgi:hypothetical protein
VYEHVQSDLMRTEDMSINRIVAIAVSSAAARRADDALRADTTPAAREARQP